MNILAIEPYYGGSHKAFLDGWVQRSRHNWTILDLPPSKWKWRMRHSAVTMANRTETLTEQGNDWDLVFCSDMLNLAEFIGLAPANVSKLPSLVYFHENQLSYPVIHESEFDFHFAFSNMTTALAANRVWFNSDYNRDSFLNELLKFLKRMPDHQPLDAVDLIREKSDIRYPCISPIGAGPKNNPHPHILWAARWEYDKNPALFFRAIDRINERGLNFEISVVGGTGGREPNPIFAEARKKYEKHIRAWGYIETRKEYESILRSADICVSTADHEFFGIGIIEALSAGAFPLVPSALAYPETLNQHDQTNSHDFFYDGSEDDLVSCLEKLINRAGNSQLWNDNPSAATEISERYLWDNNVSQWDDELEEIIKNHADFSMPGALQPEKPAV